ncbi:MAG: sugar phosphate isomerase/epimerase [Saprospiraceae bacterium]|nr:sugar phosphate isomerase/epimerase [Saprospiraceae bacterium]
MNKPTHIAASLIDLKPETLEHLSATGVGIELSAFALPEMLSDAYLPEMLRDTKRKLKDFPNFVSMHGAFYSLQPLARDPWIADVAFRRMEQSMQIANELGIEDVVFHANYFPVPQPDYKKRWLAGQKKFWERLVPVAEKYGVIAHIENTREPDPTYLKGIVDHLDSPHFGIVLDTGHTHCFTNSNIPVVDWVKGYGERLTYLHVHSNHGKRDEHIAFTEGTVNFTGFFEALSDMETYPKFIVEVKTKDAFDKSFKALKEMRFT